MAKYAVALVACVFLWMAVAVTAIATLGSEMGLHHLRLPASVKPELIVQHHSLIGPMLQEYYSAGLGHWDFGMSTTITDDFVRLTPDKQSREGYLWNDVANHLPSWTAQIGFRVHSKSGLGGDGFAFWYTETPYTAGGPLFGIPEKMSGLGVIFDTFDNDGKRDNPGVQVIVGHDHEVFRTDNDLSENTLGGCPAAFRNTPEEDIVTAIVEYSSGAEELSISLVMEGKTINCARVTDIKLPDGNYFGFTSHTGHLADNHDIHYFVVTATADDQEKEKALENERYEKADELEKKQAFERAFDHNTERAEKEKHRGHGHH